MIGKGRTHRTVTGPHFRIVVRKSIGLSFPPIDPMKMLGGLVWFEFPQGCAGQRHTLLHAYLYILAGAKLPQFESRLGAFLYILQAAALPQIEF